jgi:hypothetical protein
MLYGRTTLGKPDSNVDDPILDELQEAVNACLGRLHPLTSALKGVFIIFAQSRSSKLGAICTTQLIGLSGCDAKR